MFSKNTASKKALGYLLRTIFFCSLFFLATANVAQSQEFFEGGVEEVIQEDEPTYRPLAPLPGIDGEISISEYFSTMYQIGVSIVLVIAVVMLVYGGIQYMTSDSIVGKSNGRDTVAKAIIGIVLAVTSYALLYVIGGPDSVRVGFDVPDVQYVAPPPPPGEVDDSSCTASFTIYDSSPANSSIPVCPADVALALSERRSTGIVRFTETQLVDYFERGGYALSNECILRGLIGNVAGYAQIDMGGCQAESDSTGLLDRGTPEECFNSTRSAASRSLKEFYCTLPQQQQILFMFPTGPWGARYDDPGACYQLNSAVVEAYAEDRCIEQGGVLEEMSGPNMDAGLYCFAPASAEECQSILAGEFTELDGLSDQEWDELFCDARSLPTEGTTAEQRAAFLELREQFFDSLLVGNSYQTSGYYTDANYREVAGSGTHWHTGIDIGTGGQSSTITSPVSGRVVVLREPGFNGYDDNGKFAVIETLPDGTDRAWVFTHADNFTFEHGQIISAGAALANVGERPCFPLPGESGLQCDMGAHLDLNIYTDVSMIWGPNDPRNWTEANMTSGRHPNQTTIAGSTMCPFHAYWESINAI